MRFNIQFTGKENGVPVSLTLAVDVDADALKLDASKPDQLARLKEHAWDAFKAKSGLRRWPGDTSPVIEVDVHNGFDSGPSISA